MPFVISKVFICRYYYPSFTDGGMLHDLLEGAQLVVESWVKGPVYIFPCVPLPYQLGVQVHKTRF